MKHHSLTHRLILSVFLASSFIAFQSSAASTSASTSELINKAKTENAQQKKHNIAREAGFKHSEAELKAIKAELEAQRTLLQKQNDKLADTFSQNEEKLVQLEEQLRLEVGSLGEVFGVVRQHAKELQSELDTSVTAVDAQNYSKTVEDIVAATELPSMAQLNGLWHAMEEQIRAGGELAFIHTRLVNGTGIVENIDAARLGAFGLVDKQGYIRWDNNRNETQRYQQQPEMVPNLNLLTESKSDQTITNVVIDPSRGEILSQLALAPTLKDRIEAGGVVGKIILGLLVIGLLIALVRGLSLSIARQKIRSQLKSPETPKNNPLGRVLSVYNKDKNRSVEALELRLMEVVVDEQLSLEKGLSMLKLLAALAPMLGLLGTVTGMIETFQVITQFGNGDPKVMAGGISMALVTTVLGLVAAMPLLLAHNILSSQAETIRNILEKQGIGLVAEQAENDQLAHEDMARVAG